MTTTLRDDDRLTDADEAAIALAIEMERAVNPKEIAEMLCTRTLEEVGRFAVGRCQDRNLNLKPWECPPYQTRDVGETSDDWGCRPNEVALLNRMRRAGVSKFHPNPLAVIEAAEAESRR
jgi:hypothetical protein